MRQRLGAIWRLIGGVSLRIKILGIALAMIALLGLGLTWQVRRSMMRALSWELERQGISIARNLAARSADLILAGDSHSLHQLTQHIVRNNEDVQYAFVLGSQEQILSHSFDGEVPADVLEENSVHHDQPYALERLQTEEGVILDVAVAISEDDSGLARVGLSQHRLSLALAGVTRQILLVTLLVSLLGVGISTALTWFFTRPLLELTRATRRVVEEDLSHRLTPWADDEVGQLQASFNVMVQHLERSRREMEASHRHLLRRNRELYALYAISRAVAGPLELAEVLERALHQVMSITRSPGGWICMLGEDSLCRISATAWEGIFQPDVGPHNRCLCPACLEAREARRPVVVERLPDKCRVRTACDGVGRPVTSHIAVPFLIKERVVGLLNLVCEEGRRFEAEALNLLEGVGRQLGVAVENVQLWEKVRRKEALRGELLRKIITAQEEERKRIARELHDQTGQALASLLAGLNLVEKVGETDEIQAVTSDMRRVVDETLDELHNLAWELRPSVLDELGLVPALARYVGSCPTRFGFEADLVTAGLDSKRLPREVETTLYRIAQEALTNVARHSGASHTSVLLERRGGSVVLLVEDNGRGFDVARVMASAHERGHLGIYGMEERVSLVGGRLAVESAPGVGTTISVEVPLEAAWLAREMRSPKDVPPSGS